MEMCYDGALVMPSNYTVMSEDEMMYTRGGWCVEAHLWGCYVYLTHKERQKLTTGQTIAGLLTGLASCGIAAAVIGAAGTLVWNYDDGNGVKIRINRLGTGIVPTGFWALTKKQEKNIAKQNKVIW